MNSFHISSVIWLSLEDYYNAGLTPEIAKKVIESMEDPAGGSLKLRCENQFINGNWNVHTGLTDKSQLYYLAESIYRSLDEALKYGDLVSD